MNKLRKVGGKQLTSALTSQQHDFGRKHYERSCAEALELIAAWPLIQSRIKFSCGEEPHVV